jgi:hypothetical protein
MQVNSRAGYYTSKSPSMHLHEWLLKEKRRKAYYQPRKLEDGRWICKVGQAPIRCRRRGRGRGARTSGGTMPSGLLA